MIIIFFESIDQLIDCPINCASLSRQNLAFTVHILEPTFSYVMANLLFLYPATQQWQGIMVFALDVRVSVCQSISFSFPDDNLSKHQWNFTKLGMCIDIVEILFGIINGQICQILIELSARDAIMATIFKFFQVLTRAGS